MPASPPPSPSWLQEQKPPLSRLGLENSASRSPVPAHMSPLPLSMSLVKDGWSGNSTLIPSTKAASSPVRLGMGGSSYPRPTPMLPTTPVRFWSSEFVSSFTFDLKTRSRNSTLAIMIVSGGKKQALVMWHSFRLSLKPQKKERRKKDYAQDPLQPVNPENARMFILSLGSISPKCRQGWVGWAGVWLVVFSIGVCCPR